MNSTAPDQAAGKLPKVTQSLTLKNEIVDGKAVARPAASRWHNIIATNLTISIGGRIQRSSCEVYSSDMQVRIGRNSICFPDVLVVKDEPEFADTAAEILLNPTVVMNIFSSSTRSSDRTEKLEGFLAIPKMKECLLVNETEMRVEHYARQNPKQWIYRIYNERDDVINLDSIGCKISLAEVYAQVRFRDSEFSSRAVN